MSNMTHTFSPNSSSYSPADRSYTDEISTAYERLMEVLTEESNIRSKLRELFEQQSQQAQEALEVAKRHCQAVEEAQEEMLRNIKQKKREIENRENPPPTESLNDVTEEQNQNTKNQPEINDDGYPQESVNAEEEKQKAENATKEELTQLENEKQIAQERLSCIEERIIQVRGEPISYKGVIEVWNATTNDLLGYISKETNCGISRYSKYLSSAAYFSFTAHKDGIVSQAQISAQDGIHGFPFLGLIHEYSGKSGSIAPDDWNYLVVGGTSHSAPGATPQAAGTSLTSLRNTYESSVWTINATTGDITPQWVNPDGSTPTTFLIGWSGNDLFGSGDIAQTKARFSNQGLAVKLKFNYLEFHSSIPN